MCSSWSVLGLDRPSGRELLKCEDLWYSVYGSKIQKCVNICRYLGPCRTGGASTTRIWGHKKRKIERGSVGLKKYMYCLRIGLLCGYIYHKRVAISHRRSAQKTYCLDRYAQSRTERAQVCITQGHTHGYVWVICGASHQTLSTAVQGGYTHS